MKHSVKSAVVSLKDLELGRSLTVRRPLFTKEEAEKIVTLSKELHLQWIDATSKKTTGPAAAP